MAEGTIKHDELQDFCDDRIKELREPPEQDDDAEDDLVLRHVPTKFKHIHRLEKELKTSDKDQKHFNEILAALQRVVDQLGEHLHQSPDFKFKGTFIRVGSSRDGTRPGYLSEVDYLYEVKIKDMELFESKNQEYRVYDEDESEIVAKDVNECIRDTTDAFFMDSQREDKLPQYLEHAGFACPRYSGVRRNGPATTLLLKWKDLLVSIDITIGLVLPHDSEAEILTQMGEKLAPIRKDNSETTFDLTGKIHLVPQFPDEKLWQLSTSKLEADVVQLLHEKAPVKRMIKIEKLLVDEFQRTTHSGAFEKNDSTKELLHLLEFYQDSNLEGVEEKYLRRDVMKAIRYAHIFLPAADANQYHELVKPPMAIRSYAIKHLTLVKGAKIPGAFSPTGSRKNMNLLLAAVFQELTGQEHVNHFFTGTKIAVLSWAAYGSDKRLQLAAQARDQCKSIVERFQRSTHTRTPFNQRNDPIKSTGPWTFLCGNCRKVAFTSDEARRAHGNHLVVIDPTFKDRFRAEVFGGKKVFEDAKFEKTHDVYCGEPSCAQDWGILVRYIDCFQQMPMVKIRSFLLKRRGQKLLTRDKLKKAPFEIADLTPAEFQKFPHNDQHADE